MRRFACGLLLGACLIPLVGVVILLSGWAPVHATADPTGLETFLARKTLAASVARHAPKPENPVSLTSENLLLGMKIYRDDCSGCHGDSGKPSHWGTTAFYPRVPQFDSEPPLKPECQMFWIVKRGVRYTGMAA